MTSGDAPSGTPGDLTSAVVFLFLGGVSGEGFLPGTGSRAETRFLALVPLRVEGSSLQEASQTPLSFVSGE